MAKRGWLWVGVAIVTAAVVWLQIRSEPETPLRQWRDIVALAPVPRGLEWAAADAYPAIAEAAAGMDPEALREALRKSGFRGLWVATAPASDVGPEAPLTKQFSAGSVVRGFRGRVLTDEGLLYAIDETTWPPALVDRVLARAAREILEGSEPPPLEAFPDALTEICPIEVMVFLVGARGPRLWRSARSESIAEGLVTASVAARKRWEERMETMGGPLGQRLDDLDVHVAFLFDDGTFDRSAISLIDALVKPEHGVAYEQPSRWRYLLPRATHNAASPTDAYRRLFRDNGLPEDSFDRRDIRLYRMRMQTVSVDQGSTGSRRGTDPSGSFD